MTPNYFRWIKHPSSSGDPDYDGYTLHEDESFQTFTGWGTTNYSAAGFSSKEDINFESGSVGSPTFAFDVVDSVWWD